jgi:hypothetical protein
MRLLSMSITSRPPYQRFDKKVKIVAVVFKGIGG